MSRAKVKYSSAFTIEPTCYDWITVPDPLRIQRRLGDVHRRILRWFANRERNPHAMYASNGQAWHRVSVRYLARQIGRSVSRVMDCIQDLKRAGILFRERRTKWLRKVKVRRIIDGRPVDQIEPGAPRRDISLSRINPAFRHVAGLPSAPTAQKTLDAFRSTLERPSSSNWGRVDVDAGEQLREWRERSPSNPFLARLTPADYIAGMQQGVIPAPCSGAPPS